MGESLTFTWSDVYGEARPSPTTKKRLEEWRDTAKEARGNFYKLDIYQLDFLSDVIGELQNIYDEMLTKPDEVEKDVGWYPVINFKE
mgnify:FL=1|jgi:hypothetical protein|tara:strand:- start:236 stop:496 length:261 start_codon:yes stop_codon:yes gene_type:complete